MTFLGNCHGLGPMWIKSQKSSCAHHALECTWTATDRLFPDRSNSKSCRQPNGPARTSNGLTNIFLPKPILQFCFETATNAIVVHRIYKTRGDFSKQIHLLDRFGVDIGSLPVVTSRYQLVTKYFFKKLPVVTRIYQPNPNVENYVENRYQLLFKGDFLRSWIRGIELLLPKC